MEFTYQRLGLNDASPDILDLWVDLGNEVQLPVKLHSRVNGLGGVLELLPVELELAGEIAVDEFIPSEENYKGLSKAEF